MARQVFIIPHNHFDPTWRRCFDRVAVKHGVTVRGYAEVEDHVLTRWLALAEAGYPNTEGQMSVLRAYLRKHPEAFDTLRALAHSGQFACVLAGETVQDSNIPTGEGLIRNFLAVWPEYCALVGEEHPGLKLAWLEDAFGNNANYPQILRGVGAEVACMTSYRRCPDPVWVGIDGAKILCLDTVPMHYVGSVEKHPPCPQCQGVGCATCDQTGLAFFPPIPRDQARESLHRAALDPADIAFVYVGGEETLPDPGLFVLLEEMRTTHPGVTVTLGTMADLYAALAPHLAETLAGWGETPTMELNPAMPGCMVTRIKTKQRARALSYHLVAAEAELARDAWQRGQPTTPPVDLNCAWQQVAFSQFHDSITGTHIDQGYAEVQEMLDAVEQTAAHYLPRPIPPPDENFVPAAAGVHGLTEVAPGSWRLVWGAHTLTVARTGILELRTNGEDLCGVLPYGRLRRPFCIGELVLEPDYGDAWGTRIETFISPADNWARIPLGDYQTGIAVADGALRWEGVYTGGDTMVAALAWTVTLRPGADGALHFTTDVRWDTHSRRLRVLFPVATQHPTATYEIPFGFIARTYDPAQINFSQWAAHQMEFPTQNWASQWLDDARGVAVLNRGLPCYRWQPGYFDVSLLRSPEWQFSIVEQIHYEFWDHDGQRDSGEHQFHYALLPFTDHRTPGALTRTGYAFNAKGPWQLPCTLEGDVAVTAWKLAEDGKGWILRLYDAGGEGAAATLEFPAPVTITETDLLERPLLGTSRTGAAFTCPIHRHGILTLRISTS